MFFIKVIKNNCFFFAQVYEVSTLCTRAKTLSN